ERSLWLRAGTRLHPCAAYAGRQGVRPRCRYAPSTASGGRGLRPENRFRSPDIVLRTAIEDRVLSLARHQRRHPHSAKLAWPYEVSVRENDYRLLDHWRSLLDTEDLIRLRNSYPFPPGICA